MPRLFTVAASLAMGTLALTGGSAAAQSDSAVADAPDGRADETMPVIVQLVDLGLPGDAQVLADGLEAAHEGVDSTLVIDELNLMAAEVTSAGLAALERAPAVLAVRPARQDLRLFLDQSTVTIGASGFHLAGSTGAGRVVAVIDSGIDTDHPGLIGSVIEQGCFLQGVPTFVSEPGVSVKDSARAPQRTTGAAARRRSRASPSPPAALTVRPSRESSRVTMRPTLVLPRTRALFRCG